MKYFMGIDPGKSGGIAVLDEVGQIVTAVQMPPDPSAILMLMGHGKNPSLLAFMELVHSSPQMGVKSAFTFGEGFGALKMALAASAVPYDLVTPQRWQAVMECRTGGDKNISKARAQHLWPQAKITHFIADSLLIAEYGRRLHVPHKSTHVER